MYVYFVNACMLSSCKIVLMDMRLDYGDYWGGAKALLCLMSYVANVLIVLVFVCKCVT